VVIANKQIEHAITCLSGHSLNDLFSNRGDAQIMDGDCIEGL